MQPLDRIFFGPLKPCYFRECDSFMQQHPVRRITLYQVATLVNLAYVQVATMSNAINGFRCNGIFLFNANIFSDEELSHVELNSTTITNEECVLPTMEVEIIELTEPSSKGKEAKLVSPFEISPIPRLQSTSLMGPTNRLRKKKSPAILTDIEDGEGGSIKSRPNKKLTNFLKKHCQKKKKN
jgi:hypothetical protein